MKLKRADAAKLSLRNILTSNINLACMQANQKWSLATAVKCHCLLYRASKSSNETPPKFSNPPQLDQEKQILGTAAFVRSTPVENA